jgi:hypothetical protein
MLGSCQCFISIQYSFIQDQLTVLELDLPQVPRQNSGRGTHALAHGTGKSRIGVRAAGGRATAQSLCAYLSINHGHYSERRLGGSDELGETHKRTGEVNLASRY